MHATTLGQLNSQLKNYVPAGQSFSSYLNQALEVVYGMGIWRDLTIEGVFDCSDGYITLPEEADSVLYAIFNNQPARVHSLWHDYRAVGDRYDSTLSFGLVDDGFKPLLVDLDPDLDYNDVWAVPSLMSTDKDTEFNSDAGEQIDIIAATNSGERILLAGDGVGTFGGSGTFNSIESITFSGLLNKYEIRTSLADSTTVVTMVGPGDGVCRFRRYRVPQATPNSYVHILCKRQFLPLQKDSDIVYINNTAALKHALLGIVAEDNADLDRSEIHWAKCRQILDEQLDQYRGPARPSLDLQMSGEGILATRNLY